MLDSAVGFVFLTYLPPSMTAEVLDTQQRQKATRTIPAKEVDAIREGVRRDRIASTSNQMIFGLPALAAPIFGADGDLELVLGLVLPTRMSTAAESKRLGRLLRSTADRASQELGLSVA